MKRILYMTAVLLLATACTEKEFAPDTTLRTSGKVELCASVEDIQTKASMGTFGEIYWKSGDKIAVSCNDGTFVEFTMKTGGLTINGVDGGIKKAVFAGEIPQGKTLGKVAVWPVECVKSLEGDILTLDFPNTLTARDLSDTEQQEKFASPMVALINGSTWDINFRHVAARMNVQISNIDKSIGKIELSSDERMICGEMALDLSQTEIAVTGGSENKIEVDFGEYADIDKIFGLCIYLPVGDYSLEMNTFDADGNLSEAKTIEEDYKRASDIFSDIHYLLLDRGYVEVGGVKWARGNLQYKKDNGQQDFRSGWRIAPYQWHNFRYANAAKSAINAPKRHDYSNSSDEFEHFNFGGIGAAARDNSSNMAPVDPMSICGKIFSSKDGSIELEGDEGFLYDSGIWGDLAFWASQGRYRMPTDEELGQLHDKTDKLLGYYVTPAGQKIWGVLFRTSNGDRVVSSEYQEFTDEDLETGLFLPNAGRRANAGDDGVIAVTTQGTYRSGDYHGTKNVSGVLKYYSSYFHYDDAQKAAKFFIDLSGDRAMGNAFDGTAGFLIRPVLNENYVQAE